MCLIDSVPHATESLWEQDRPSLLKHRYGRVKSLLRLTGNPKKEASESGMGICCPCRRGEEYGPLLFYHKVDTTIFLPTDRVVLQTQGTVLAVTGHVYLQLTHAQRLQVPLDGQRAPFT